MEMETELRNFVSEILNSYVLGTNNVVELEAIKKENTKLKTQVDMLKEDQKDLLDYITDLENELSYYEANEAADVDDDVTDCCSCMACGLDVPCCDDPTVKMMPAIYKVYFCDEPDKEKVIVLFADGTKVIKEPIKGDIFDLNVGVALCIAEKMFGSKSKYHKAVRNFAGIKEKRNKIVEEPAKKVSKKK